MILERYIHREILEKLGWVTGILLLVLTSNRFVDYLADAALGKLPSDLIFQMLLMKMLAVLPRILPISLFVAVILALSRLSQDKELTIVSTAGIADGFQYTSIFRFSVIFTMLVFIVSFIISPWAEKNVFELKERARVESDITGIASGQFKEFSKGDRVVYVEQLSGDKTSMKNVFLQVRQDKRLGVLNSDNAKYEYNPVSGSRYISFGKGHRYVGSPGQLDYQITEYRTYAVLLDEGEGGSLADELEAVPSIDLIGSERPTYKAELQWRLSYVLSALLLPVLAVALNRFSFSEHRYSSIFIAIMIYFIYSNLLGISKTLLKRDNIPSIIGLWWVHILLIVVIILIVKIPGLLRYRHVRLQNNVKPVDR